VVIALKWTGKQQTSKKTYTFLKTRECKTMQGDHSNGGYEIRICFRLMKK
jgi:hypothetical protein